MEDLTNSLIRCKNTRKDVILKQNGSSVIDPSVIAEVFNNYISNVTSNLDRNIPHSNSSPLNFLEAPLENSFFNPPSDSDKIVNLIRGEKNKSTDLMNIPVFIFKIQAPLISPTVSILFNNSLYEGIFPECFKTAIIIQNFKSGDSNSTVNYRPISMLPFHVVIFQRYLKNWCVLDQTLT